MTAEAAGRVETMGAFECSCAGEAEAAGGAARAVAEAVALLRRHFRRAAAHAHAADYLRGLIVDVERKNGWQLAERAGYGHPRGIQRVLDRYAWDAEAVRDDLRAYVAAELGDPDGLLVVDETGFPKQGRHSAGVARQCCGVLGKVANCQVGVVLGYAGPRGPAAIDRALFVPQEWLADPARCRAAAIPEGLAYRTKPQLALAMLERALAAGVPARWVVADEVYGSDGKLRRALEERGQAYVLAVRSNEKPSTWPPYGPPAQVAGAGRRRRPRGGRAGGGVAAVELRRGGAGAAPVRLGVPAVAPRPAGGLGPRPARPPPPDADRGGRLLPGLRAARRRSRAGGRCGRGALDDRGHHQARQGASRARPLRGPELARLASPRHPRPPGAGHAGRRGGEKGGAACPLHVPLTVPELRRLLVRLVWAAAYPPGRVLAWSRWRRRHQKRAQDCHRQRRLRQKGEL